MPVCYASLEPYRKLTGYAHGYQQMWIKFQQRAAGACPWSVFCGKLYQGTTVSTTKLLYGGMVGKSLLRMRKSLEGAGLLTLEWG